MSTVIIGTTAVGAIVVATIATTIAVGTTIVGTIAAAIAVGTTAVGIIAAAIAIRTYRDIVAAAASRGSGEGGSRGGGGGYRGSNDVSVRGRLVSNAVGIRCPYWPQVPQIPSNLDGALQILATWPFRPHRSQWGTEPLGEGSDSS